MPAFSSGHPTPQALVEGATQEILASQAKAIAEAAAQAATAAAEATAAAAAKGAVVAGGVAGAKAEAAAGSGSAGAAAAPTGGTQAAAAAGKPQAAEAPPPPAAPHPPAPPPPAAPTVEELVRKAQVTFASEGMPETLKAAVLKEAAQLVHQGKGSRSIACHMRDYAKQTYGSHGWQCTVFTEGHGEAATAYSKTCFRWIMGQWHIALWRVT